MNFPASTDSTISSTGFPPQIITIGQALNRICYKLIAVFVDTEDSDLLTHQENIPIFQLNDQDVVLRMLKSGLRFICHGKRGMTLKEILVFDQNQEKSEWAESRLREEFLVRTTEDILGQK